MCGANIAQVSKNIIQNRYFKSIFLLSSLGFTTATNAAIVQLDFTTYMDYSCVESSCNNYWDSPIVSEYRFIIDTSTVNNSAYTDAYNNTVTYTEVVNTTVYNQDGTYPIDYTETNATVNQTYSQYDSNGSVVSEMTESGEWFFNYYNTDTTDQDYTGSLPPELAPDGDSTAVIFNSGYMNINWTRANGVDPVFVVYDEASLISLYESMIGNEFRYNESLNSRTCSDVDEWGNCVYPVIGEVFAYSGGTAVLTSVNAVPVPAAVWLFGSGLIGLAGIARRKKA